MDLTISKKLFEEGIFLSASIVPAPSVVPAPLNSRKWLLMLNKANGDQEVITIARTKNTKKIYKRYIAAINDAHVIGFNEIKIVLN